MSETYTVEPEKCPYCGSIDCFKQMNAVGVRVLRCRDCWRKFEPGDG